jgi:hypothetical protein
MPQLPIAKIIEEFPFLDDRSAQEPFLYDILSEIKLLQKNGYAKGNDEFATREHLLSSRSISMPFTPAREKNIDYLLELLITRYSFNITMIASFDFTFDDISKKMSLVENEEYAMNLTNLEIETLKHSRDQRSLEQFTDFIRKFRLFNLDKVIKRARNREDIGRIIDLGLKRSFFTYKHYFMEKNRLESVEDYCFHAENYEHVKRSLNLMQFRAYIATYVELVRSRLRKFGIMNTDISDYRDNKIDYILSVFLDDLSSTISDKDRVEIKNFKALRDCVLVVDKILEPAQIRNADILAFIREHKIVTAEDICSGIMNMNAEILAAWDTSDRLLKEHIVKHDDHFGLPYYMDGPALASLFATALSDLKILTPDAHPQVREKVHTRIELLYKTAKQVLHYSTAIIFIGSEADVTKLSHLIDEYESYVKKMTVQAEMARASVSTPRRGRPLYLRILSFFSSIFSVFSKNDIPEEEAIHDDQIIHHEAAEKIEPGRETKQIYEKANAKRGPIVALSDLIELTPDNEYLVSRIIQELRAGNMKIVVPVFNARSVLYPKRSSKLLMSDIEYLLVPLYVVKSLDQISEYINSLVGIKLKEEVIPGKALIAIERYLKVIYRQRRSSQVRKKEMRERSMKK